MDVTELRSGSDAVVRDSEGICVVKINCILVSLVRCSLFNRRYGADMA